MNRQEFLNKLFAAAAAAGIAESEAYIAGGENTSVEILDGQIKEYSAAKSEGLCFRGVYEGRMGYASTEEMDEDAIEMLVNGVRENAALLETDDNETIFEGVKEYAPLDQYCEETASMPASEMIERAKKMEERAKAADPHVQRMDGVSFDTLVREKRIVNSRGLDISYRSALAAASVAPIVADNGRVNFDYEMRCAFRKDEIPDDELADRAVAKAVAGLNAESVPSGSYRVVLRNDAARTLLSTFAGVFSAENARKGLSLLKDREGERVAAECVTIIDDPLLKDGFASVPFDAEGVPTFTKTVVEKGVLRTLLHNRTTAKAMGKETTGNAAKAGYAAPVRVAPTNFFIAPSQMSFDELLEEVGNGLLITSMMGMHSGANQISGDFSLGAKGFLIENGRLGRPVEQITIASNFFDILKNIRRTASDLRFGYPGSTTIGSPALDVGMISVAGK